MIKIGATEVDTIKIGATDVDKVMLNGVEIYPADTEPACDPLTGDAAVFLTAPTSHTYFGAKPAGWNATMESLPDDRVFPEGQKMFIQAWDVALSFVPAASESGYTIVGPWRDTYDNIKSYYADSRVAGDDTIQVVGYLRNMRAINNPGGCISCAWDGDNYSCSGTVCTGAEEKKTQSALVDLSKDEVDLHRNDPNLQGHKIHSWLYALDDWGADTSELTKLHGFMGEMNDYLGNEAVGSIVKGNPFATGTQYTRYMPEATQMQNQTYFDGGTCPMTGYESKRTQAWWVWEGAMNASVDSNYESPSSVPRIVPVSPIIGLSWPSDSDIASGASVAWQRNNTEYMTREIQLAFLNGIMGGFNGFTYYNMGVSSQGQCGTSQAYRDSLRLNTNDFIKKITEHGVDRALLWGLGAAPTEVDPSGVSWYWYGTDCDPDTGLPSDKCKKAWVGSPLKDYTSSQYHSAPINMTQISGGATYKLGAACGIDSNGLPSASNSAVYDVNPLNYRDIQYQGNRFVVVTNSLPDTELYAINNVTDPGNNGVVVTDFSGFPTNGQIKITDILSGTDYTTDTGTVRLTMQPNTAVILKVEPADGFCGGNEPQPAPVITEHPQDQSVTAPAPASWSVAYSPPTASVQWQWHPVPFTDDDWRNIDGETGDTYSKVATNTGMNGENYRAVVTTAGNDPVPSNPALLTVT